MQNSEKSQAIGDKVAEIARHGTVQKCAVQSFKSPNLLQREYFVVEVNVDTAVNELPKDTHTLSPIKTALFLKSISAPGVRRSLVITTVWPAVRQHGICEESNGHSKL